MPFDFGIGEIAIVLVIGLLVFGPKKLPEISRGIGSGMRDFRRGLAGEVDAATAPVDTAAVPTAATAAAEAPVAADAPPATPPVAPPVAAAAAAPSSTPAPPPAE